MVTLKEYMNNLTGDVCIRMLKGAIYKDRLYFMSRRDSLLIAVDLETGLITVEDKLDFSEKNVKFTANCLGDSLVLFPTDGNEIIRYGLKDRKQFKSKINYDRKKISGYGYTGGICNNEHLYLFPGVAKQILSVDLNTMKSSEILSDVLEELYRYENGNNEAIFCVGISQNGSKALLPGFSTDTLTEINLDTMEYEVSYLENETGVKGYRNVSASEDRLYLVNRAQSLMVYDRKSKKQICKAQVNGISGFSNCLPYTSGLIFVPEYQTSPYFIREKENGDIETIQYPDDFLSMVDFTPKEQGGLIAETNQEYIFYPHLGNMLIRIDKANGQIRFVKLHYSENITKYIFSSMDGMIYEKEEKVYEGDENGLYGCMDLTGLVEGVMWE